MKKINTVASLKVINDGQLVAPVGQQSSRPINPEEGSIRGDKSSGYGEIYLNGTWVRFGQNTVPLVGIKTSDYVQSGSAYVPIDTTNGSFTVTLDLLPTPKDRIVFFNVGPSWYDKPFSVVSTARIDGEIGPIEINNESGYIEFVYVNDTIGYAVVNGEVRANESDYLGSINVTSNTTAKPRYEYVLTADVDFDLKLPLSGPEGALIRFVDGLGAGDTKTVRIVADDAIVDGNRGSVMIGQAYGSITFMGKTINGRYRWIAVSDTNYETDWIDSEITGTLTMSVREDRVTPTNTSGGSFTVTLPSDPRPGQRVWITDSRGTWHLNPLTVNFGAKGSYPYGASVKLTKRYGSLIAIYNYNTQRWDVLSNNDETGIQGWETKTGTFVAQPYMGYRLTTSATFTVNLPDPNNYQLDAFIRLVMVSNSTQGRTNAVFLNANAGQFLDGPMILGGQEAVCLRIKESGGTKVWYRAEHNGSSVDVKHVTNNVTCHGKFTYRHSASSNCTILLDTTYTRIGDYILIHNHDGSWAGKSVVIKSTSGTLDGWSERTVKKGYGRLLFQRTHDGFIMVSENFVDYRNVSGNGAVGKHNDWMRGIFAHDLRTGTFTAISGYCHNINHSAPCTVTLPTPTTVGEQIAIVDYSGRSPEDYIVINCGTNLMGGGRSYMNLSKAGAMVLFEARYNGSGMRWYPIITPDGDGKVTYDVDVRTPYPNSNVPVYTAGTHTLPSNAEQGDTVTFYEHEYRTFKTHAVYVRSYNNQEMMNVANRTMRIPPEVASITFVYSKTYNSWQIQTMGLRVNTADSKLDLVTNLTWVDTSVSQTAQANFGYKYNLAAMAANRVVTLPTSGIEVNSVVQVSTRDAQHTNGRTVSFSGGTIDGVAATSYEPLKIPGETITLVNRGNGVWIVADRTKTNAKINFASSNTINLDFTGSENTVSRTITGTTNITASFPAGVTTTFFILLRQDGTGNRAINVPSTWKRSAGSEEFNLLRNTYNLIQGVSVNGIVFYNVTTYI